MDMLQATLCLLMLAYSVTAVYDPYDLGWFQNADFAKRSLHPSCKSCLDNPSNRADCDICLSKPGSRPYIGLDIKRTIAADPAPQIYKRFVSCRCCLLQIKRCCGMCGFAPYYGKRSADITPYYGKRSVDIPPYYDYSKRYDMDIVPYYAGKRNSNKDIVPYYDGKTRDKRIYIGSEESRTYESCICCEKHSFNFGCCLACSRR